MISREMSKKADRLDVLVTAQNEKAIWAIVGHYVRYDKKKHLYSCNCTNEGFKGSKCSEKIAFIRSVDVPTEDKESLENEGIL